MNANAGGRSVLSRLPGSAFGARHRRAITRSSLCAGAILLVIAIAAPTFIVPSLKELPTNIDYDVSTAPTRGILIDSAAFKAGHPSASHSSDPACVGQAMPTRCYIETDVPLRASEKVTTASSSKKTTKLRAVSTLYAGDLNTPERENGSDAKGQVDADNKIGSIHDEVVLNRHTAFPSKKP
ncbi:porin PorA family protein, partial [Corynebacterium sp.]|uniref:porin PorA family protein n=1 Tax=Corynebacterium sp. TaxID=1720 RepID=UPI0026DB0DA0